jgi:protein phosphatase
MTNDTLQIHTFNRSVPAAPVIEASGATDIGRVRARNEDAYLIATLQRSIIVQDATLEANHGWFTGEPAGTLLVVADGMGGMGGGDIASRVAVQTITEYSLNVMPWVNGQGAPPSSRGAVPSIPGLRNELAAALVEGDSTVRISGERVGEPHMGTTLTLAFVLWPVVYVAHVGDSRCYLLRSGTLSCLTTDHTLAQQLSELGVEPIHSSWHHLLWNSLGGSDAPTPQTTKVTLDPSDTLLLCSDGLTKHVSDAEIATVLASGQTPATLCSDLIARANERGGSDNVTVVVARLRFGLRT